ncbi:hypothetical protein [Pelagicoccus sp. SDUM812003]|uniref:hypothetical protein n=1 Tax=Pelagicoccus sp. SDUM812003 TaxID=3041267 RepID=UPI00280D2205|nr:hypothetical protein [Pelagicoccus sp. SDUM812003]MDQ8201479.1 hypothetical protein [Pelagicoccus sp. SDUM812003]
MIYSEFLHDKREALERASSLLCSERYDACQRTLESMEPEAKDCEDYHATWLATLVQQSQWAQTVAYAEPLVERHGGYCRTFYSALVSGLKARGKTNEAFARVKEARAHWPSDPLFVEFERLLILEEGEKGAK